MHAYRIENHCSYLVCIYNVGIIIERFLFRANVRVHTQFFFLHLKIKMSRYTKAHMHISKEDTVA